MTPDISRDSFDPSKHFTRVIQQQGRVQLDSDWNEQVAIQLAAMRRMFTDLVGPYAAPPAADDPSVTNFRVSLLMATPTQPKDLIVGKGSYYVSGIRCENPGPTNYSEQPSLDVSDVLKDLGTKYPIVVYLDAWEEPVTADDDPSIREAALGGPDTAARARVAWAIRADPTDDALTAGGTGTGPTFAPAVGIGTEFQRLPTTSPAWQPKPGTTPPTVPGPGRMRADLSAGGGPASDPCTIAPDALYRGTENQLYRVEIHGGGAIALDKNNPTSVGGSVATFKWSRDNGAIALAITEVQGSSSPWTVFLQDFGRDDRRGLDVGDWVEIVEPGSRARSRGPAVDLLRVTEIDPIARSVTLERPIDPKSLVVPPTIAYDAGQIRALRPLLRRWDQTKGVVESRADNGPPTGSIGIDRQRQLNSTGNDWIDPATDDSARGVDDASWFDLEDGIRVQFQRPLPAASSVAEFRPGDYWLIPARTASNGTILWPTDTAHPDRRADRAPDGIKHHYAPLAVVVDPMSDSAPAGAPDKWIIDRRTIINRANLVTPPSK